MMHKVNGRTTQLAGDRGREYPITVLTWADADTGYVPRMLLTLDQAERAAVGFRAAAHRDAEYGALADELDAMVAGMRRPPPVVGITVEAVR